MQRLQDPSGTRASAVFHEPPRDLPLDRTAEVMVCGGGPAGIAAALAAACRCPYPAAGGKAASAVDVAC